MTCNAGQSPWEVAAEARPHRPESKSGDVFYIGEHKGNKGRFVAVIDVLGHGERAHGNGQHLLLALRDIEDPDSGLTEVYRRLETAAFRTRGCAAFLGRVCHWGLEYIMIGNLKGWLVTPDCSQLLLRQPGVIGKKTVVPVSRSLQCHGKGLLIVCSDGVRAAFSPGVTRDMWTRDLKSIVSSVLREFQVAEDDACVLIARKG